MGLRRQSFGYIGEFAMDAERADATPVPEDLGSGPYEPPLPIGTLEPLVEDWVYDIDAKPWGVADIQGKKLSLRRDEGGGVTRRFIRPKVVPGGETGKTTVEIGLHHHRRTKPRTPSEPLLLNKLKQGDWVRIALNSDATLLLYKHLENLYAIGDQGIGRGRRKLRVVDADEITVSGRLADIIARLRAENGEAELAASLEDLLPDLVDAVALKREHAKRVHALYEFEAHMPGAHGGATWDEPGWKRFFQDNDWIFGHNLDFQFLVEEEPEAYVGGKRLSGKGSQFADHVRSTPGDWSFAVLVEIKRPDTALVLERKKYREGTWSIHPKLADSVAQAQSNVMSLIRHSNTREGHVDEVERELSFADPEGILVIGTVGQLTNDVQRETFHRFRRNLWNPRILTFDELLARARFQVEQMVLRAADDPFRAAGSPPMTGLASSLSAGPTRRESVISIPAAFTPLADVFDEPYEHGEEPPGSDDDEPPDDDDEPPDDDDEPQDADHEPPEADEAPPDDDEH